VLAFRWWRSEVNLMRTSKGSAMVRVVEGWVYGDEVVFIGCDESTGEFGSCRYSRYM